MASSHGIYRLFVKVCDDLKATISLLHDAKETIAMQDAELVHLKICAESAFNTTRRERQWPTLSSATEVTHIKHNDSNLWIDDIWLCTPQNSRVLAEAEQAWMQNPTNPQAALNIICLIRKRLDMGKHDRILCMLLEAAVLLSGGRLEESCARANIAMNECGFDRPFREFRAIAHFLRGRYLLERQDFTAAFWDFSVAVRAEGYRDRAKDFRQEAELFIRQKKTDIPPVTTSLMAASLWRVDKRTSRPFSYPGIPCRRSSF